MLHTDKFCIIYITLQLRMWSWRHCWKYLPIFRFYIYSGIIMFGILKYVVPCEFYFLLFLFLSSCFLFLWRFHPFLSVYALFYLDCSFFSQSGLLPVVYLMKSLLLSFYNTSLTFGQRRHFILLLVLNSLPYTLLRADGKTVIKEFVHFCCRNMSSHAQKRIPSEGRVTLANLPITVQLFWWRYPLTLETL